VGSAFHAHETSCPPSDEGVGAAALKETARGRAVHSARGKRRTIVAVAAARELTGFCWAIATAD
jgi:hypothetical protein